jgi:hypothetical protein
MVSSICYIIRGYLKEFNTFIASDFVQSIQTASPQILNKAFNSRTLIMYRFNFQDYTNNIQIFFRATQLSKIALRAEDACKV